MGLEMETQRGRVHSNSNIEQLSRESLSWRARKDSEGVEIVSLEEVFQFQRYNSKWQSYSTEKLHRDYASASMSSSI